MAIPGPQVFHVQAHDRVLLAQPHMVLLLVELEGHHRKAQPLTDVIGHAELQNQPVGHQEGLDATSGQEAPQASGCVPVTGPAHAPQGMVLRHLFPLEGILHIESVHFFQRGFQVLGIGLRRFSQEGTDLRDAGEGA